MPTSPRSSSLSALLHLLRPFWPLLTAATLLGVLGGLSVTGLLAAINRILHAGDSPGAGLLLAFAGLCALALAGSVLSDIGTNRIGQRVIARLRKDLGDRILTAPIDQLERYRSHRLIPVLTHDVDTISDFAFVFAPLAVSLSVTLGSLVYLALLSWPMFLATAAAILIGSAVQYVARGRGIDGFQEARAHEDELQKHYRSLAEGAKELRINRPRRLRLQSEALRGTIDRICEVQIRSITLFVVAKGFGSTLFFIVIGVALGVEALWPSTDRGTLSGFILVLLYMKGPLEHLIGTLPIVSRAQVAFRRIAELSAAFASPEPHLLMKDDGRPPETIDSLELRDARYAYPPAGPDVEPFVLGPVSLRVGRGEILFIVGENGCGKTTLIKMLLGLYAPQDGDILLNGTPVTPETRDDYRQLFTTIFADYFLFDDLIQTGDRVPEEAQAYLERLEIAHKVSLVDGVFSTTDLSTGQRKRLALLQAWTEGRPVLVFDEWAADQDPAFRRIFYTELLPSLKAMGKTIIVISHDDRYFDVADHLLRLTAGMVAQEEFTR
ncbi:cyclic peptide transporter (plasmid) [Azospirillum baldaniorum]|uniref:Cyclic peptide transporter n=1 Tax=Azospirillum baldaniorum TaxID=1064539 RepID=A0A9P1JXF7_9PROT|nr:cyclic peptide export ABC transporter [Azospirillum baldaniorum]TWA82095.1 putative ATP-binding cassette transporter [Azospirillum brasilense]AWJ93554.1 cyclic peptide transporter [Azospirillum baldaniorum]NUB08356.1 cyclic peptide export ABC transporter [Azospirillum baldaniorum]TWA60956.1 putative ATP-binding cassette transporter [Azospirillum baldaniorum]CCD01593.1 cyclic peptide transporter [Azospirillum baldaniorum]